MSDSIIVEHLRKFFLLFVGFMCIGTVAELLLAGHFKEPMQYVPFVLCGLGAISVMVALRVTKRTTIQALRFVMLLLIIGSVVGVYEHIESNFAFIQETRPNADWIKILIGTLAGGSPLLAPGTLSLAAITAIAATYYHPALQKGTEGEG